LLLGTSVINKTLKSKPKKLTLGKDALALKEGTYSGKDFTYSIILYSLIYCAILIDVVELDDSPVSPITYWMSELKLKDIQRTQLLEGAALTDRHIHGASVLLAEQFPDIPSPQCSLRSARLEMMKKAKERSFFSTILTTIGHYLKSEMVLSTCMIHYSQRLYCQSFISNYISYMEIVLYEYQMFSFKEVILTVAALLLHSVLL